MKKFIIFLISFFLIVGCSSKGLPSVKKESSVTDAITFKTEFENANTLMNDDFSIDKDNAFKYLKNKNVEEIFANTNVVFIGNATDLNSRVIVKILNSLAKNGDIKSIYYMDSLKNFAKYEINVNGQIKSQEESELYDKVLTFVKSSLASTEKLSSPSIIFIKDGKVVNYYTILDDLDDNVIDTNIIRDHIIELLEKLDA